MKFFVFGTLKKAHGNNRIMRDGKAVYLGDACTMEPYIMIGLMVWPYAKGLPVRGEVWDIGTPTDEYSRPARTLRALDRLENNGHWYNRREVPVRMLTDSYGMLTPQGEHMVAWLYEGMGEPRDAHGWDDGNVNCDGMHEWSVPRERQPVRTGSILNEQRDM